MLNIHINFSPPDTSGPSKSELKKRAKEAEKQKKASEKAARLEEQAKAAKAAEENVRLQIQSAPNTYFYYSGLFCSILRKTPFESITRT